MEEDEEIVIKAESDEEDYENFFLQPATSPYNIAEKVEEANKILFDETSEENSAREQRVKFRETLVDFEPDLTDDDVQSIESYNEADTVEELKYVIQKEDEIYDIVEEVEDEVGEECIEEDVVIVDSVEEVIEGECDSADEVGSISEETVVVEEKRARPKSARRKTGDSPAKRRKEIQIECRSHCIEELETRLDVCISKLQLGEKPDCPPLKLHRRKCCEGGVKPEQKLPLYTGLRSEYGLSAAQIDRLQKRQGAIRRREEKRLELQEAYRKRRVEQNELIFCQWLKEISDRKQQRRPIESGKPRPKTSLAINTEPSFSEGRKQRRRPHTTATCVYVEIPERYLKAGIKIGDLFISNRNVSSKHIQLLMYT